MSSFSTKKALTGPLFAPQFRGGKLGSAELHGLLFIPVLLLLLTSPHQSRKVPRCTSCPSRPPTIPGSFAKLPHVVV